MKAHPVFGQPLRDVFVRNEARSKRASSWDRTGGNDDWLEVQPGQTVTLMKEDGPGCITHMYCTMALPEVTDYRDAILRCYWDGEERPSVEVPLGDFFGVAHGRIRQYQSHLTAVNPGIGVSHGLSAHFPMPFSDGARVTLENRGEGVLGGLFGRFWYHIDYEAYEKSLPEEVLRFHAQYRQERPTAAVGENPNVTLHEEKNLDGLENYVALEAEGAGQMVGLLLEVNNLGGGWYGEGDDMVFLDGETWPPSIHGTGTEEIFGGGACPSSEYAGPHTGFHLVQSPTYEGLVAMYRWYVHDRIRFHRGIRWTIEHGHANNYENEYYSVAYWYQTEPHASFPALPTRKEMRPPLEAGYEEARTALLAGVTDVYTRWQAGDSADLPTIGRIGELFYQGDWAGTLEGLRKAGLF